MKKKLISAVLVATLFASTTVFADFEWAAEAVNFCVDKSTSI